MDTITVEYKGFTISYDEANDKWLVTEESETSRSAKSDSLTGAKKRVDALIKLESEFEPFEAVMLKKGWDDITTRFVLYTITSVDQTDSSQVWVKDNKGTRSKISVNILIAKTAQNRATLKDLQELEKELSDHKDRLETAIKEAKSRLTPVVLPTKK